MSLLKAQVSFPSNVVSVFSTIKHNSSILSFSSNIIYFGQKQPLKVQIFEIFECSGQNLSIMNWKVNSSSNLASFSLSWHVNFMLIHFLLWIKWPHQNSNFRLPNMPCWKFAKFFRSILKGQVSFPSNVASVFTATKHNFPVIFKVKHYVLCSKEAIKVQILKIFKCSG